MSAVPVVDYPWEEDPHLHICVSNRHASNNIIFLHAACHRPKLIGQQVKPATDTPNLESLAALPHDAPLGAKVMAAIFGVGPRAIGRMVQRGELPPGIKVGGRNIWMAGVLREHLRRRAEDAAKLAEERRDLMRRHRPHRKR